MLEVRSDVRAADDEPSAEGDEGESGSHAARGYRDDADVSDIVRLR
jgi:hypothetical protein